MCEVGGGNGAIDGGQTRGKGGSEGEGRPGREEAAALDRPMLGRGAGVG